METIRYFDILKRAFLLTWKNKFMWFFGGAVFLGSLFSNANTNIFSRGNIVPARMSVVQSWFSSHEPLVGAIVLVVVILAYVVRVLGAVSIIVSANNPELYRQMKVGKILSKSVEYFWKIVLLEVVLGLGFFGIILILIFPIGLLFSAGAKLFAGIAALMAFLIALPLVILVYFIGKYGMFYIVLVDSKIRFAIESAYVVFVEKMKKSFLAALIIFVAGIVFWSAAIVSLSPLLIVGALLYAFAYAVFSKTLVVFVGFLLGLLGVFLMVLLGAFFETFCQVFWLIFFKEIAASIKKTKSVKEEAVVSAVEGATEVGN
jgi:hypothetical protein